MAIEVSRYFNILPVCALCDNTLQHMLKIHFPNAKMKFICDSCAKDFYRGYCDFMEIPKVI